MQDFVVFDHVCKTYQMGEVRIDALKDASFTIEEGEICVIVGQSGAGKTTLLNILGGMDRLTSGHVLLAGEDIAGYDRRKLTAYRRHGVGFVFQFYNLLPNMTALENVQIASQLCEDPIPAEEVLQEVGLGERMQNFPAQLSGGEQQRGRSPRAGQAAEAAALRRADGRARLSDRQADPRASAEAEPRIRHDGRHHHPQFRPDRHGRPRHPCQKRADHRCPLQSVADAGGKHRVVTRWGS